MANLKLTGVKKSYGEHTILHGIDLDIESGEFVVFVGPSGCGKSTLLRSICGLEQIDSGDLFIGGKRMNDVPPAERGLAMVFQSYALYPHMTVFENMAFSLKLAGKPKEDIHDAVMRAAHILRIEALLKRKPKELSGGQRQRVAIGRAIVRQPQVFLFDEPLSNLDAALRVQMRIELANLHRTIRSTMIYVTHDQVEAMTLADRIVVLNGGRIEQIGSPLELYKRPANLFVAGFLGAPAMNFLSGRVAESSSENTGIELACGVRLSLPLARPLERDAHITLGVRPEHVSVEATRTSAAEATIYAIEQLGDGSVLYVKANASSETLTIKAEAERHWEIGQTLTIGLPPTRLHVFGHGGRRLALTEE